MRSLSPMRARKTKNLDKLDPLFDSNAGLLTQKLVGGQAGLV